MSSSQDDPDHSRFGQIAADHVVYQVEGELDPAEEDRQDFAELYLTEAARQTVLSLADSLASELSFEHLSRDQIKRELEAFVGRDQRSSTGSAFEAAREFIHITARPPKTVGKTRLRDRMRT